MRYLCLLAILGVNAANAAHLSFHFAGYTADRSPEGFRALVVGQGKPADWRIVDDETTSAMQRISDNAPVTTRQHVLAQVSKDPTDERFPVLYYAGDTFGDFTLTTRFKLVSGVMEQMAGVVFRMQDENNFYVIRVSGLGNNIRFYKVVSGVRGNPIGVDIPVTNNIWYTLKVDCHANQIRCWLNDNEVFPALTDNSFSAGKIGFWTKSDAVSYFGDSDLDFTPREPFAQVLIRNIMKEQPRLLGLTILAPDGADKSLKAIASNDPKSLHVPGTDVDAQTFKSDAIFQAKGDGNVTVVMPLHDRNGDTIAVVHLVMESFPGQTEQNVIARALPIVKMMQARVGTSKDLLD